MLDLFKTFTLTWWQAAIFKATLLSYGILLAAYFPKFAKKGKLLWWAVLVLGSVYLIVVWYPQ